MNKLLKSAAVAATLLAAAPAIAEERAQFPVTNSERGCAMLAGMEANAESCRKLKASANGNLAGCALAAAALYNRGEGRRDSDRVPKGIAAVILKGCGMLIYDRGERYVDSVLEDLGLN